MCCIPQTPTASYPASEQHLGCWHQGNAGCNQQINKESINRQDSTEIHKMHMGLTKLNTGKLFVKDLNVKGIRGHSQK